MPGSPVGGASVLRGVTIESGIAAAAANALESFSRKYAALPKGGIFVFRVPPSGGLKIESELR